MAHLPRRKLPRGDGGVLIQIQSLEIAGYDTKVKDSSSSYRDVVQGKVESGI